jgi:hypothetical protein
MPDSVRVKEIHEWVQDLRNVLGSEEHKTETLGGTNPENIYHNTVRIKRILGISTDPKDRSIRPIRQRAIIKAGMPIPSGWNFGQWGENEGEAYQKGTSGQPALGKRDGIATESICNQIIKDPFRPSESKVISGDYVLCENLIQLWETYMEAIDKAVDLQNFGGAGIRAADGSGKIQIYEGMHQYLTDIIYMLSAISKNTSQSQVSGLITQAVAKEILAGLGLPIVPKTVGIDVGGKTLGRLPYPGLAADAPSLIKVLGILAENLSILVGQAVREGERD